MGTRAITNIYDGDTLLCTIYRQSDGYLSGHGKDIADALGGRKLVNGITGNRRSVMNGMGCAAALLIACLKSDMEAGSVYIHAPDADATEDFEYILRGNTMQPDDGITLTVTSYGETLYDGPLADFDPITLEKKLNEADDE